MTALFQGCRPRAGAAGLSLTWALWADAAESTAVCLESSPRTCRLPTTAMIEHYRAPEVPEQTSRPSRESTWRLAWHSVVDKYAHRPITAAVQDTPTNTCTCTQLRLPNRRV